MTLSIFRSPSRNPAATSAQWEVVAVIHGCIERDLSAAEAVTALASDHDGWIAQNISIIGARLFQGASFADALDAAPALIGRTTRLSVRIAEGTGTLRPTLAELTTSLQLDPVLVPRGQFQGRWWLEVAFVLPILAFLLAFTAIFITPTIQEMFEEFGIDLPAVSTTWFASSEWIGFGVILLFFTCLILPVIGFLVSHSQTLRDFSWMNWFPPVRRIRRSEVLAMLSMTLRHGRPVLAVLSIMARHHGVTEIERRLAMTESDIIHGSPMESALSRNGFLTTRECQALETAPDSSSAAWALLQFAQRESSTGLVGQGVARSMIGPIFTLLLAALVFWFALAFFMPLITLISSLADSQSVPSSWEHWHA